MPHLKHKPVTNPPGAANSFLQTKGMGNQHAVARQGAPFFVQPKLTIGSVDDVYEKEADAMANNVMQMPAPAMGDFSSAENLVSRKCACVESEKLQRKETGSESVDTAPPIVQDVLNSSAGKSLDESARAFMEPRFNYDFSNVKIHDNSKAAESAGSINALAYTLGNNVVFNSGQYDTNSGFGKRLLAHELTHVVQQNNGVNLKIQRMAACPARLNDADPVPAGFKPYYGNSYVFHCGFRGILEDRKPAPGDPMNECFYDHEGTLVTESHPFSGCRGTPDYYDSETDKWNHFANDPGGVVHAGGPALLESIAHPVLSPIYDLSNYLDKNIRKLYGAP